jgi:hypothetical protein
MRDFDLFPLVRCMMTENFSLIRGMPGSGKTTTIVGLIRNQHTSRDTASKLGALCMGVRLHSVLEFLNNVCGLGNE